MAVLALVGTVAASVLFFYLVQITTALFASTVSYFIPVVAVVLGLFDGEIIRWPHLVGMAIILLGVFISNQKGKAKAS